MDPSLDADRAPKPAEGGETERLLGRHVEGDELARVANAGQSLGVVALSATKAALGAGSLFLPLAFHRLGLALGLTALLLSTWCTLCSQLFLVRVAHLTDARDYRQLAANAAYGPRFEWLTAGLVSGLLLAPLVVHLRLAGQCLAMGTGLLGPGAWMLVVAALGLFPLGRVRNARRLAWCSVAGLAGMAYVVVLVAYDLVLNGVSSDWSWLPTRGPYSGAVGTILFACSSHLSLPMLAGEMRRPSLSRMHRLVRLSAAPTALAHLVLAVCSHLRQARTVPEGLFGDGREGRVFVVARLAMALASIAAYPFLVLPLRSLCHWITGEPVDSGARAAKLDAAILLTALACSQCVFGTSAMTLGRLGSVCGAPISLVLPSVFYLRLYTQAGLVPSRAEKLVATANILAGLALSAAGLVEP